MEIQAEISFRFDFCPLDGTSVVSLHYVGSLYYTSLDYFRHEDQLSSFLLINSAVSPSCGTESFPIFFRRFVVSTALLFYFLRLGEGARGRISITYTFTSVSYGNRIFSVLGVASPTNMR